MRILKDKDLNTKSYAMNDEIHRSKEAGCDYHLAKPFHSVDLINLISHVTK